jgi:hypothetical protein
MDILVAMPFQTAVPQLSWHPVSEEHLKHIGQRLHAGLQESDQIRSHQVISISDVKIAQVAHANQHQDVMIWEVMHFMIGGSGEDLRHQNHQSFAKSFTLWASLGLHIGHLLVVLAHLVLLWQSRTKRESRRAPTVGMDKKRIVYPLPPFPFCFLWILSTLGEKRMRVS